MNPTGTVDLIKTVQSGENLKAYFEHSITESTFNSPFSFALVFVAITTISDPKNASLTLVVALSFICLLDMRDLSNSSLIGQNPH